MTMMPAVGRWISGEHWRRLVRAAWADAKRAWFVTIPVLAIWVLAVTRVFIDPTPWVPLLVNVTPSLPYTVAWLQRGVQPQRGEFVLYRFSGVASETHPGLARQPLFKIVAGEAGDVITVRGRDVFLNDEFVGRAKEKTFDGHRVTPIAAQTIPNGYIYVRGTSPDSFDSRYHEAGLVELGQVIGRVDPWF